MIDTSIQRVEINQVIENQLPEFVQTENPLFVDFMKQYYTSQEYQGGSINIAENLDRYTKLQTYVGAALTEFTGLSTNADLCMEGAGSRGLYRRSIFWCLLHQEDFEVHENTSY